MTEITLPVRLMLLLDSRSPAGAHSHSGGMESAVAAGWIRTPADVADFCRGRLDTAGRVAAAFTAYAAGLWLRDAPAEDWRGLDAEFSARTTSEATRSASRTLGSGLRRLLLATAPAVAPAVRTAWSSCPRPAPHQPLVLGAAAILTGGDPRVAARAAALLTCTGPASAAIRLLGLDPFAVHTATAELADEIEAIADVAAVTAATHAGFPQRLPADSAPAIDLLADVHARTEVRLFAS